jgi:multidrug transporter EmrE-like cation transporter
MTLISFIIVLIAITGHAAGEIALKKAMETSNTAGFRSRKFMAPFVAGIFFMTVQFFLGIGLLQKYDLSFIYPFQGLNVIMIAVAAAILLREKLNLQLIVGSILISAGIVLVSIS